ncbi:MAG: GFA family protein [Proteobacteria bacterium]|nr:GFA family protein [Pseudomonadota bacterium]
MPETQSGTGSCACGAVKITAESMGVNHGACHCSTCRKWAGGPFMSVFCGPDVKFHGEDTIGVFDSSKWADRGFCKKCGSALFYRIKQSQSYHIPIGLFDQFDQMEFVRQVFIDKKPDYYSFANETKNMTEEEVFKIFGGS